VLGIDIGTTYTGAAIVKRSHASVFPLGNRSSVIPTVVLLDERGVAVTGEAANRRAMSAPGRVAREFKRRVGDTTPLLLGGVPMSPQTLMARMLESVIDRVTEDEGADPAHVAVSHPANWGPYKLDLLEQAVRLAGLDGATMISEPEAAAAYYASTERLEIGEVVAVYDLGGGTFDAAVVRRTELGFEILGTPGGIEHLGGIDIDEAVFGFVTRSLGDALAELDLQDPTVVVAAARLRRDCVDAKEALSVDEEVVIPVLLPGLHTDVTLTKTQLEEFVRPMLVDTIASLRRAVLSADLTAADLTAVLLVGGSSRMPIVAEMVGSELGRPVAVDAHPKHSVALGTALTASRLHARMVGEAERQVEVIPPRDTPRDNIDGDTTPDAASAGAIIAGAATGGTSLGVPPDPMDSATEPDQEPDPDAVDEPTEDRTTVIGRVPPEIALTDITGSPDRTRWYVGGAAAAIVVALIIGLIVTSGGRDDATGDTGPANTNETVTTIRSESPAPATEDSMVDEAAGATTVPKSSTAPEETVPPEPSVEIAGLTLGRRFSIESPNGIALDGDNQLWTTSAASENVIRIQTDTGRQDLIAFPSGSEPVPIISNGVSADGEPTVWVGLRGSQEVAGLDTGSTQYARTRVSAPSSTLGWGGGALWSIGDSSVDRVDPATSSVTATIDLTGANALTVLGDAAWITQPGTGDVAKIDLASNEVVATYAVGAGASAIATDGEALWVANSGEGTVARFDPVTNMVTHRLEVGAAPVDIQIDGDRIWVLQSAGSLVLIDRVIVEVVDQINFGAGSIGLEVLDDQVWVAVADGVIEVRVIEVDDTDDRPSTEIVDVALEGGRFVPTFSSNFTPDIGGERHVHLFWNTVAPADAGSPGTGPWVLWDTPERVDEALFDASNRPPGATAICILIATPFHEIADVDGDGLADYDTGNCAWVPDQ
jgi:molecular chaperone DnaK